MFKFSSKDKDIVEAILTGGISLDKALEELYDRKSYFNEVRKIVLAGKGNEADAEDIFQESMAALVINIQKGAFRKEAPLKGYFLKIASNRWKKRFGKNKSITDFSAETFEYLLTTDSSWDQYEETKEIIDLVLDHIESICKDLFQFRYQGYNYAEIAELVDLPNENKVRDRLYRCRTKFQKFALKHPFIAETLNIKMKEHE